MGDAVTGALLERLFEEAAREDAPEFRPLISPGGPFARIFRRNDGRNPGRTDLQLAMDNAPEWAGPLIKDGFDKGVMLIESPIEAQLLPWLLAQRYYPYFPYVPMVLFPNEGDKLRDETMAVVPQLSIGRYRADFAIAAKRGGPSRFVLVECDGEAYHDADKDAARDKALLSRRRVLDIVRLPARIITADPQHAALLVAQRLTKAWQKNNLDTAAKFQ